MSCSRKQSCASCVWVSQPVPGSFRLETARAPVNMKGKKEKRMGMQPTDAAVVVVLQESKRHTRIIVVFNVWQYIVTKHGDWSRQNIISQSSPKGFWERAGAPNWEHQNHTPKESGETCEKKRKRVNNERSLTSSPRLWLWWILRFRIDSVPPITGSHEVMKSLVS